MKICALQIMFIKDRTSKGQDVSGNAFTAYNSQYAKRKLAYRGNLDWLKLAPMPILMNSFITEMVSNTYAKIIISNSGSKSGKFNTNQLAMWHNNGMGNNPQREFFAISDIEAQKLQNAFNIMIIKDLNNV
jgi:hypothetical protein